MRIGMRVILRRLHSQEGSGLVDIEQFLSAVVAITGVYAILKIGIQS